MDKKYLKDINLRLNGFEPFENDTYRGIEIYWVSNIGFGKYNIYQNKKNDYVWFGDSESMDNNKDKNFLKGLLMLVAEEIEIIG